LKLLFEAINQARSEHDMRSQIVPKIGEYFAAKRSGIFFFDQLPLADSNLQINTRLRAYPGMKVRQLARS
jgi:hypothetical protein